MFYVHATQQLRNDHRALIGLFRQFESMNAKSEPYEAQVVQEMFNELKAHSQIETEIFYPALREHGDADARAKVEELEDGLRGIDAMIQQTETMPQSGEKFFDAVSRLIESAQEHMNREEEDLLPLAERQIGTYLGDLGVKMQNRKTEILSSLHLHEPWAA